MNIPTLKQHPPLAIPNRDEIVAEFINPFHYDMYHMGIDFSQGTMIMMANHTSEKGKYMILVNKRTGERVIIDFPESWQ